MKTCLILQYLLILIILSVSSINGGVSGTRDDSGGATDTSGSKNHSKEVRNRRGPGYSDDPTTVEKNGTSEHPKNVTSSGEKPSVVGESLNATIKNNGTHTPSNETGIVDDKTAKNLGNSSIAPNDEDHPYIYKNNGTLNSTSGSNSTQNGGNSSHPVSVSKPAQNATSSGEKPSVIDKSLNVTTKNNETHVPSNETVTVDDKTAKNPGNHSIDKANNTHTNQTKDQSDSKPAGNSTQNGGNSSHPIDVSKPLQNATSSGEIPSIIDKSLNATTKSNETIVSLKKREVVDDKTAENLGNSSKASNEDSKDQKSSPIDKANSTKTNQTNEQSNSKPAGNSTQNGGNSSHPIDVSKPLQNVTSIGEIPSIIVKGLNATTKNNETHVPSNETVTVDDKTAKNLGNNSKASNEDSKDHKSSLTDKANSTHTNQTNLEWETKPSRNSTQNGGNSSHLIDVSKPLQNATSIGEIPSIIVKGLNETTKINKTILSLKKREVIDDKTAKNLGNSSKASNEDSKDHKTSPIDKANSTKTNQTNEQSNSKPAGNSTQNGGNSSHPISGSKPLQNATSIGEIPSVIDKSLNATTKNNETHVPLNETLTVDDKTAKNLGNHSKGSNEDTKDQKSSPIDKTNNTHTNQTKDQSDSKPAGNSTQNAGNSSHPIDVSKPLQNATSIGEIPSIIVKGLNATTKNNETHVPSNETVIVDDNTVKNPGNHSIDKGNNTHANQTNEQSNSKPARNSTQKTTPVTPNNISSDLQEIKRKDDGIILPILNDSFEGGTANQPPVSEYIDK